VVGVAAAVLAVAPVQHVAALAEARARSPQQMFRSCKAFCNIHDRYHGTPRDNVDGGGNICDGSYGHVPCNSDGAGQSSQVW